MSHPTEKADLFGKRFVVCIETEENRRLAESLVKDLTGGDRQRARRIREDFWEFDPTHKVVLCINHRPVIRGTDFAIWRHVDDLAIVRSLVPWDIPVLLDCKRADMPNTMAAYASAVLEALNFHAATGHP